MEKLDQERTFAGVEDQEEFMQFVYNSLVRNQYLKSDGAEFTFGSKSTAKGTDVAKAAGLSAKRVLHFKTADDWFDYNDIFGVGNLKESFFSGLQTAGRNGIMDTLGTKPQDNFNKIRTAVGNRLNKLEEKSDLTRYV